jgi:hypothetical protein
VNPSDELRIAPLKTRSPVTNESTQSFLDMLGRARQVQTSQAGLKALGAEEPKGSTGILSRLFDERAGYLTAPWRAVMAFGADVAGFQDRNLERYNPIESAARAFAGQFAVTGGDIFKVQRDDNFATRLGKYAGALALDIGLDPVTYLGPVGAFNKVRLAEMAVSQSDDILKSALSVAAKNGVDEGKVVDGLFQRSRIYAAAKAEQRAGIVGANAPQSALASLGATGGIESVSTARKMAVAAQELGNLVGESLMVGGRGLLQKDLVPIVGSKAAAGELFQSLPQEIAGGFFLKRPLSGRPVARLGGGTGDVLPGSEALSRLRFRLSASGPARWMGKYLDGQSGPLLADVKRGLVRGREAGALQRDTIADYVNYKKMLNQRNVDFTNLSMKSHAIISGVGARKAVMPKVDAETFDSAFKRYFDNPNLTPTDADTDAVRQGFTAAQEMSALIRESYEEMVANGVPIGDLGNQYRNLIITDAERDRLLAQGVRGAGKATSTEYNPLVSRSAFTSFHPDPEIRALLGTDIPELPGGVFLSPKKANDIVEAKHGYRPFEEDPIKVAAKYTEFAARTIAARRFTQAGIDSGVLLKFPSESKAVVDSTQLASLLSALSDLNPTLGAKAQAISKAVRDQVQAVAGETRLKAVQDELAQARGEALRSYQEARAAVEAARVDMVAANRAVADASDMFANTYARMAEVADAGISSDGISALARATQNNRARLNNARRALDDLNAEIDRSREMVDLAQQIGDPNELAAFRAVRDQVEDAAQTKAAKVEKEFLSLEDAEAALDEARAFRSQYLTEATGEQLALFNQYEMALNRQRQAAQALEAARAARDDARMAHLAAEKNVSLAHARGIDVQVERYLTAATNLRVALRTLPPASQRTDLEKKYLRKLQEAVNEAKADLRKTVGYSKNYTGTNLAIKYADEVVRMADSLVNDEVRAALLIADSERLGALIEHYVRLEGDSERAMYLIGDLVEVYKNIRKVMTKEDLANLTDIQRRAFAADPSKLKKQTRRTAQAAEEIASEGGVRGVGKSRTGADAVLPRALEDTYAPNGVADLLEEFYSRTTDMSGWRQWLDSVFDPAFLVWKSSVTVGRGPAFVFLNTIGGMANNYLARVSAKSHKQAAAIIAGVNDTTNQLIKENPNQSFTALIPELSARLEKKFGHIKVNGMSLPELYMDFLQRGGHFTTDMFFQYEQLAKQGVNMTEPFQRTGRNVWQPEPGAEGAQKAVQFLGNVALSNPYMRFMSNLTQTSETFIRMSAFIEGWARYKNLDTAMNFSMMLHFDYSDLSQGERWVRRLVPFYVWTRRNIPLQMRMIALAPDQMGKLFKANANIEKAFGTDEQDKWLDQFLPDYITDSGGFLLKYKFGGNHLALWPRLPMQDLEKSFRTYDVFGVPFPFVPSRREMISQLGPTVKSPIELLTNRNFEMGYEYDDMGEAVRAQLKALFPQYNLGRRLTSGLGAPWDEDRRVSNLYQVLIGAPYSMGTFNERALRGGMYRRSVEVSQALREAAEEANVDVTWLREEIRNGTPLPILRAKIQAGHGDPARLERARAARQKPKSPSQYLSTVRALEQGRSPYLGY